MVPSNRPGGGSVGVRPRSNSGENGGRSRSNEEMNDAGLFNSGRNISSESAAWVREYRDNVDLLDPKEFDDEFFSLNPLVQQGAASVQAPGHAPSFSGTAEPSATAGTGGADADTTSEAGIPSSILPPLPQPLSEPTVAGETTTSSDSPTNPGLPPKPDDNFLRGLSSESVARGISSDSFFRDLTVDPYLNAAVEAQKKPTALPKYPPHPCTISNAAMRALSDDIRGMQLAPNEHKRKNDADESPMPAPAPAISPSGGRPGRRVTTKPPVEKMIPADEVSEHDVLGGKGGQSIHHPGNIQFRQWAEEMKPEYSQLSKQEKTPYSWKLVHKVWEKGGRFLEKDDESGKYYVIFDKDARLKASQALREEKGRKKKK
eukprot:CAMPEP_0181031680 /NCGR_PEP_ID=MMETSP1070-20121207/6357_1 /TAXON_ID=265543 /ORGANISM="Minutocellus polymorphus, Strain NH13" /LENGTH=373 /DNA_ID=CAMNT_0023109065 /DNA_START=146 /DNA_END=1267 /DNA_ORIENTATION=-